MKREDGRKADEIRPIEIEAGVIKRAAGSARVKMGKTEALAAVYGPKEMYLKFKQDPKKAVIECKYMMAPFSTDERCRPGPSRRSIEISKVVRQALEPAVFLEEFPKSAIRIQIEILQADAGTRTAAINAAAVALADAGIPMRDLVASVSAGKIGNDYVIDLAGKEEEETACDLPIAYMPGPGKFTLVQMDGDIPQKDVFELIKLARRGCEEIIKKQREALKKAWMNKGGKADSSE